jgi:ubiquinone/menaquinone biosynthesis C-methylase UbiE
MGFIPPMSDWLRSHYEDIPRDTATFLGDLTGLEVLDIGAGEMLTDFGMLPLGVSKLTALDVHNQPPEFIDSVHQRLTAGGFRVATDYRQRIEYVSYDGENMPFPDESFDVVCSWGVLEHVQNLPRVLAEARRVCKESGRVFLFTYPFWTCFYGSHLSDFIAEPFFHLKHDAGWVRQQLEEYAAQNPDWRELILIHMWQEFLTLNRYGSTGYHAAVRGAGFRINTAHFIAPPQDLSGAPSGYSVEDLMVCGSKLVLTRM